MYFKSITFSSPQFWGHLLRIEPMFNLLKIQQITSPQNRGHLTHPNFEVSTSAHNCAHLYSAQNWARQNYGVNITQPKSWLSTSVQNWTHDCLTQTALSPSPFWQRKIAPRKLKYIPPIFHVGKLCDWKR